MLKIEELLNENEMLVTAEIGEASISENLDSDQFEQEFKILRAAKVDVGNPHLVAEVRDIDGVDLEQFAVRENEIASPIALETFASPKHLVLR